MKKQWVVAGIIFFMVAAGIASDEMREWSPADGSSPFSGSLIKVIGSKVELRNSSGRKVTVPISSLTTADQQYISAFAKEAAEKARAADRQVSLPYEQGKVVGPVRVKNNAGYFLYLPKSMVKSREAPLLFYTNAGGAKDGSLLEGLIEAAEINGWVMAISINSKNKNSFDVNLDISTRAVAHILKTLPVDKRRLYFTGNSGGGAQAILNGDSLRACGIMPNVAYIPSSAGTPKCDCFFINGGKDYNRYTSAHARKSVGKKAVHRLHGGGHEKAPAWLMQDGMLWMEGRYLAKNGKRNPEEQSDYVAAMLQWIQKLKEYEPCRAYYWVRFLEENLKLDPTGLSTLRPILDELGKDKTNRLYVEGLAAIDQLSLDELSKHGTGALFDHSDEDVVSECQKLLTVYRGVPIVSATLEAIARPTRGR